MKASDKRRLINSSGITVVLAAIFCSVLVLMVGGVVYFGVRFNSVSKLQSVANLAVQAGLNEFSRTDPLREPTPPPQYDYYLYKANKAVQKINAVLADPNNSTMGLGSLGTVGHANNPGTGGYIELGMWYDNEPSGSDPCGSKYPCFIRNPVPQSGMSNPPPVNAMRVYLKSNPALNPLVAPFAKLFGSDATIEAVGTTAVLPRAAYFGIDASQSSFFNTHLPTDGSEVTYKPSACPATGPNCPAGPSNDNGELCQKWCIGYNTAGVNRCNWDGVISNTADSDDIAWCLIGSSGPGEVIFPSAFAFEYAKTRNANNSAEEVKCYDGSTYVTHDQAALWCNMPPKRPAGIPSGNFTNTDRKTHYRSDYLRRTINVQGGGTIDILVDSFMSNSVSPNYRGPEPLSSLLLATNGALRLMTDSSANDTARIAAFDGRLKGSYPPQNSATKLAKDLGALIQITNAYNIGPIQGLDEAGAVIPFPDPYNAIHYPNFLDLRLFSVHETSASTTEGQSNLIETLRHALDTFTQADPKARKMVFLMTDFISSCKQTSFDPANPTYDCLAPGAAGSYDNYFSQARQQLFGNDVGGQISNGLGGIVGELIKSKVSVSVIQAGKGIGANFKNEKFTFEDGSYKWLTPLEAAANGRGGPYTAQGDPSKLFFNLLPNPAPAGSDPTSIHDANQYAYNNFGDKIGGVNVKFREALGLAADLAIKTGGAHCMLMEPCLPGYYQNGKIYDGCRPVSADNTDPNLMEFDCDGDGDQEHLSCAPENKSIGQQAAECIMNVLLSDPFQLVSEGPMSPPTPTPLATLAPTSTPLPTLTPTRTPTGLATNTPTRTPTRTATPGGAPPPPPPPPSKGDPNPDDIVGVN